MYKQKRYTFRECCSLLDVTGKTFSQQWLPKIGIDPETLRDKGDPRKKYITHEQLLRLAEEHARELFFEEEEEQPSAETLDSLGARLTELTQQIMLPLDQLSQQLWQRFDDLDRRLDDLTHRLANLEEKRSLESRPVSAAPRVASLLPISKAKVAPKGKSARAVGKKKARGKRLPRQLVLLRDFAKSHSISMDSATAAGKVKKFSVIRGEWLVNSRWATEALDAAGQYEFYVSFHERDGFTACPKCPHLESLEVPTG